jgi:hypothetical protein
VVLEVEVEEGAMNGKCCCVRSPIKIVVVCPCNGMLSIVCLVVMVLFFAQKLSKLLHKSNVSSISCCAKVLLMKCPGNPSSARVLMSTLA